MGNAPGKCSSEAMHECLKHENGGEMLFNPGCALDECAPRGAGLNDKECACILLVQAAIRNEPDDVDRALKNGADVDTTADVQITMGPAKAKPGTVLTPLMRAAKLGNWEVAMRLLDRKASLEKRDKRAWNAVCYALANGELDLAQEMFSRGGTGCEFRQASTIRKVKEAIVEECQAEKGDDIAQKVEAGLDRFCAIAPRGV